MLLEAQAAEKFPPIGHVVDIEGRKLQIDCRGTGSPTVVLESGGNDIFGSLGWSTIQQEIATSTRVCSYSRAGYVWSSTSSIALNAESGARDLHEALQLSNEVPPYVLVSHSSGSLNNLIFTDLFRSEVAGLVFAEPSHPEQDARRAQVGIEQGDDLPLTNVKMLRALRWTGLPRLFSNYCVDSTLTTQVIDTCKAWFPHSLDGIISEGTVRHALDTRAAEVNDLGDLPVLVLTRQFKDEWYGAEPVARQELQKRENHWRELHAEIASWSSQGKQRFVPDSGHGIPFTHPQAVVAGVNDVLVLARQSL